MKDIKKKRKNNLIHYLKIQKKVQTNINQLIIVDPNLNKLILKTNTLRIVRVKLPKLALVNSYK